MIEILDEAPEGFKTFVAVTYPNAKSAVRKAGRLASLGAVVVRVAETRLTKEHWLVGRVVR